MADDQKDRYIQYLAEQHQEDELTKKAMELVLEDFMAKQQELEERMAGFLSEQAALKEELLAERKKRKSAERKLQSVQEQLAYANEERFGDWRQKVRKKRADGTTEKPMPDRENEKDGFDGTDDTLRTDSVEKHSSEETDAPSKKTRDLSNRPDEYKKMWVFGDPIYHPSDLSKVPGRIIERKTVQVFSLRMLLVEERYEMVHYAEPGKKPRWGYFPTDGHPEVVSKFEGTKATPEFFQAIAYEVYVKNVTFSLLHQWLTDMGMTISANTLRNSDFLGDAELKSIMSDGYNAYVFIGNELKSAWFKDTVHQVCMSPAKNKFVKAANQGNEPSAALFSDDFKELFEIDRNCAGLSTEDRLRVRESLEVKEILIRIRSRLDSELAKGSEYRSQYSTEALHYLEHFWDEIFAYLQDGDFPIDNNLAERTLRKLTTQRNNSLHYGSDAGVEMAATYHSVIGTVKLHGSSFWNFIGTFFKNIFNGCRDYVNMVPDKITLATSQC